MKTKQDMLQRMIDITACGEATEWVETQAADTAQAIWDTCTRPDWMLWWAAHNGIDHELHQLACVFARSALQFVPAGEHRPRLAVEAVEGYLTGAVTAEELERARRAAWDYWHTADAAAYATAAYAGAYAAAAAADAAYAVYAADAAADAAAYADAANYDQAFKEIRAAQCDVICKALPQIPWSET